MTIDYKIIIGKPLNDSEEKKVRNVIQETFNEVNTLYNKWNPQSELSQLNHLNGDEKKRISPQLEKLLQLTDKIVKVTEGRFDPTIEPLQQLWKASLAKAEEPSPEQIQQALQLVGWNHIHVENGFFWKDHRETSLDLGGIAKGYAVDLITERLNATGYPDVYVEWGGEIRTSGQHPEKRPWKIFISRLDDTDPKHAVAHLSLNNDAIATSGDYLQFWKINKNGREIIYFHIIDPRTGYPLEAHAGSIASASVLAPTCAFADGIATALMLFSTEKEAQEWVEVLKNETTSLRVWLITRTDSIEKVL